MEPGMSVADYVAGVAATPSPDAARYQPVDADATNLAVNPPEFGLSSREHGREPTVVTESTWRTAVTAALVFLALVAVAAAVFALLGWLNTRAAIRDANGGATRCSSSGLFSAVFDSCRVVRRLPLVVAENGACYRLAWSLVWAGGVDDGPAIEWWGNRGELHACGHNITLTNATGQGVLVHGSLFEDAVENTVAPGGGELTAYDLFMVSPTQQYNELGYAVRVQNGATLWLQDAVFQNFQTAVMARNAKLVASGVNITAALSLDDEARAIAWESDLWAMDTWGINCMGSVDCSVEDLTFAASQDSASGDYRAVPFGLSSVGFQCNYSPFETSSASGAGFCRLERADITASQGVRALNAHSILVRDVSVAVLAGAENRFDTTFWGPIDEDPLNYPVGWQIGAVVQVENGSSAIVERLSVDATALNEFATVNAAVQLSSTNGLVLADSNIYGRAPRASWYMEADFAPGYALVQVGLVAIDSVVFVEEPVSPISVRYTNVRVTDNRSYAVSIGTARVEFGAVLVCATSNVTVSFDRCTFIGGAAGVLIGSGAVDQVSITDTRLHQSYYGVYAANETRNVLIERGYTTRHCEAVHVENTTANVIADTVHYSDNNRDFVDLTEGALSIVEVDPISSGESFAECATAPPFIFNVNVTDCVAPLDVSTSARRARLAAIRARFSM